MSEENNTAIENFTRENKKDLEINYSTITPVSKEIKLMRKVEIKNFSDDNGNIIYMLAVTNKNKLFVGEMIRDRKIKKEDLELIIKFNESAAKVLGCNKINVVLEEEDRKLQEIYCSNQYTFGKYFGVKELK